MAAEIEAWTKTRNEKKLLPIGDLSQLMQELN
jgi:hypothetical protein